jgi:hypothetical protein
MSLRFRIVVLAAVGLLAIGPAYAQVQTQASDVSGPSSDVSGNLTQSDVYLFQTDESRIRMADAAAALIQALQRGTLGESVVSGGTPMPISPEVAGLFLASSRTDVRAASPSVVTALTDQGLPRAEAVALARAAAGLLKDETVSPAQFLEAVEAFNAAVGVAPAGFLAQPPSEFVVVRAVLMALLDATT